VLQHLLVDGKQILVHVSMEALQDAKPELSEKPAVEQFAASRDRFLAVALGQIHKGSCQGGRVLVRTEHL
jgi:hypothetical protein